MNLHLVSWTYVAFSILAAAFFNGAEMGLLSVNRLRLRQAVDRGAGGAIILQHLIDRQEAFLATTLIASTLFTISGAAVATSLLHDRMGNAGALLATVGMTSAHVVLSEIVPKAIFRQLADLLMPVLAAALRLTVALFSPLVAALTGAYRLFLPGPRSLFVTREELLLMIKEASRDAGPRFSERKMLESVFDFSGTVAREVMIPLSDVVTIDEDSPREALLDLVRQHGHTRIPVYHRRPDRIAGFVNVFDILYDRDPRPAVRDYRREVPIYPDSKRIDRLLRDLQERRTSMAAVVNEFGSIVGIVTVEDIIEEIMGELLDEHEEPAPKIRQVAPHAYLVDARTDIDDLNDELGLRLPKERYDTVGGLILKRFGRIPQPGEATRIRGVEFRIEEAHEYGIRWVRLSLEGRRGKASPDNESS